MPAAVFREFGVEIRQPNNGGLHGAKFVRLATDGDLNGAYTYTSPKITGPANTALTNIDGVAAAIGDRVLVKNAATGSRNGIYVVNALGGASTAYELERDFDYNASAHVKGAWMMVLEGTANGGVILRNTNTGATTMDTTALTFATSATEVIAGAGLTKSGNTIDAVSGNAGLVVNANDITLTLHPTNPGLEIVASNGLRVDVGQTQATGGTNAANNPLNLTSNGLEFMLGANSALSGASDGLVVATTIAGNGLSMASGALAVNVNRGLDITTDTVGIISSADSSAGVSLLMLKRGSGGAANDGIIYSALIGDGSLTSIAVTHGLGKQFVLAQLYDAASPFALIDATVEATSTTVTTFKFASAPATNSRRAILMAVA